MAMFEPFPRVQHSMKGVGGPVAGHASGISPGRWGRAPEISSGGRCGERPGARSAGPSEFRFEMGAWGSGEISEFSVLSVPNRSGHAARDAQHRFPRKLRRPCGTTRAPGRSANRPPPRSPYAMWSQKRFGIQSFRPGWPKIVRHRAPTCAETGPTFVSDIDPNVWG